MLKQLVTGVIFTVMLAGVAMAGPFEDAYAAYERGDYAEAARLYRLDAEQGDPAAQTGLGLLSAYGDGVPQDYAEALKWFWPAAEQGNAVAQGHLGVMYDYGLGGVPQDVVLAHMWFNLATARGYEPARKDRDLAAGRMTPDQLADAQRLAREWKPVAER